MSYIKKGNLRGLLEITATSEMLLLTMGEVILSAAKRDEPNFIDATVHHI